MKVGERTQTPPQPVQDKAAEKLQGKAQAEQMLQKIKEQSKAQPASNPAHLGQTMDIKG